MIKFKEIANPKLTEFLQAYQDITILGLFWAMYWRFVALVFGLAVILGIVSAIME
jgi:hypothetical protein